MLQLHVNLITMYLLYFITAKSMFYVLNASLNGVRTYYIIHYELAVEYYILGMHLILDMINLRLKKKDYLCKVDCIIF